MPQHKLQIQYAVVHCTVSESIQTQYAYSISIQLLSFLFSHYYYTYFSLFTIDIFYCECVAIHCGLGSVRLVPSSFPFSYYCCLLSKELRASFFCQLPQLNSMQKLSLKLTLFLSLVIVIVIITITINDGSS